MKYVYETMPSKEYKRLKQHKEKAGERIRFF